jgi:hypothetical protein
METPVAKETTICLSISNPAFKSVNTSKILYGFKAIIMISDFFIASKLLFVILTPVSFKYSIVSIFLLVAVIFEGLMFL